MSTARSWVREEGSPWPLGVSWAAREHSYNFALYSKHATAVTLLLYGEESFTEPVLEKRLDPRVHRTGRIWHCRVAQREAPSARYYAYRCSGPPNPLRPDWQPFDPDKILLDPYAPSVFFPPRFDRHAARQRGSNAGRAPLGILEPNLPFDWSHDQRPEHEHDAIIYELHLRGFTQDVSSGVPAEARGTYLGLIEKIPYLVELGVTVVELMPVFQFDPQEGNYWGYMPLSFFAPHHAYAVAGGHGGQHNEFRAMVKALHQAGIEVVIDVVYNHTVESDHLGPTYSFRGIDDASYYFFSSDGPEPYANYSGTGNTLACTNAVVRKMIVDSMRYWRRDLRVDGFRFDLASIFTRTRDGNIDYFEPPIVGDISADPELAHARLIAEPWDAAGAYQLGRSFPGVSWLQWNGLFRDAIRRFVRGDPGMVGQMMLRLYGSDDLFPDHTNEGHHAYQSVNYVSSHDGFTLYDLVSYAERRNWTNGHENTDGASDNISFNHGHEGHAGAPAAVVRLRKQQVKNFAALLFLANGTPMFRAGDEMLKSQGGNTNPYNQDNEITWLDWRDLARNADNFRFFQKMIAFRKAHRSIARSRFWREDVIWYGVTEKDVDFSPEARSFSYFLSGESQGDDDLYVLVNAGTKDLSPKIHQGDQVEWSLVADTAANPPHDFLDEPLPLNTHPLLLRARSVMLLIRPRRRRTLSTPPRPRRDSSDGRR
ncbi:MAG: glycogen-debranching protein [Deltaproteobacteria bacterium]|nr:glycogen-debranching protein [Deltaproteobacteria bacterium]